MQRHSQVLPRKKRVDPFVIDTRAIGKLARTKFGKNEQAECERACKTRKAFRRVGELIKEFRNEIAVTDKLDAKSKEKEGNNGARHWQSSDLDQPIEGIKVLFKKTSQKIEHKWKNKVHYKDTAVKTKPEAPLACNVRLGSGHGANTCRNKSKVKQGPRNTFNVSGTHIGTSRGGFDVATSALRYGGAGLPFTLLLQSPPRPTNPDEVGSPGWGIARNRQEQKRRANMSSNNTEDAYFKTLHPFQAQEPGDLQLVAGDILKVQPKDQGADGWWFGKNIQTGQTGVFPSNFLEVFSADIASVTIMSPGAEAVIKGTVSPSRPAESITSRSVQSPRVQKVAAEEHAAVTTAAEAEPEVEAKSHVNSAAVGETEKEDHYGLYVEENERAKQLDELLEAMSSHELFRAALKVQTNYRRFSSSKRMLMIKVDRQQQVKAACKIQNQYRKQSLRKQKLHRENKAATTIQRQIKKKRSQVLKEATKIHQTFRKSSMSFSSKASD